MIGHGQPPFRTTGCYSIGQQQLHHCKNWLAVCHFIKPSSARTRCNNWSLSHPSQHNTRQINRILIKSLNQILTIHPSQHNHHPTIQKLTPSTKLLTPPKHGSKHLPSHGWPHGPWLHQQQLLPSRAPWRPPTLPSSCTAARGAPSPPSPTSRATEALPVEWGPGRGHGEQPLVAVPW